MGLNSKMLKGRKEIAVFKVHPTADIDCDHIFSDEKIRAYMLTNNTF
jgi:hypothetical protein